MGRFALRSPIRCGANLKGHRKMVDMQGRDVVGYGRYHLDFEVCSG